MSRERKPVEYTYYGDLLGVSSYYQASPDLAYRKLSRFYNITYDALVPVQEQMDDRLRVEMLSDSLLVYGAHAINALGALQHLYRELLGEGLLLRGAMVHGKLQYDKRQQQRYFKKKLPVDSSLARAVGLEQTQKGARLLLEPRLAKELLGCQKEWRTVEGYLDNPRSRIPLRDLRRRICPTPDGRCFEFLYMWHANDEECEFHGQSGIKDRLQDLEPFFAAGVGAHFKATMEVIERSRLRAQQTVKALTCE